MIGGKILITDVYARALGDQIMYWRINNRDLGGPVLEWTIVNSGRNLGANIFRVDHPSSVCAMRKLQQAERMVEIDNVDAHMLEHFMEWGWLGSALILQRGLESHSWQYDP